MGGEGSVQCLMGKQEQHVTYNAKSIPFFLLSLSTTISFPVKIGVGSDPNMPDLVLMQISAFQQSSSHCKLCRYLHLMGNREAESCFGH